MNSGVPLLFYPYCRRYPLSQMEHSDTASERPSTLRPVSITVLAWLLIFAGALFLLMKPLTWSEFTLERNLWNTISKGAALACGIGLLGMRRWAVVLYFGLFAINCVLIYTWPPNEMAIELYSRPSSIAILLVVPAIIGAITLPHWNNMRW